MPSDTTIMSLINNRRHTTYEKELLTDAYRIAFDEYVDPRISISYFSLHRYRNQPRWPLACGQVVPGTKLCYHVN